MTFYFKLFNIIMKTLVGKTVFDVMLTVAFKSCNPGSVIHLS